MSETMLVVDDEEYVLNSIERLFASTPIGILKATNGQEALRIIEKEDVAVLLSDNLMPGMKGTDLLSNVKELSPDTVKILMTGYADLSTVVEAINKSEVFRFIVKPWGDDDLTKAVEDGINHHRLVRSLRKADEATLLSLAQTIELKDPYTRGHCERVARYSLMMSEALGLPEDTQREIRYGSWLHDCGKIGVPEAMLNHDGPLNQEQEGIVRNHPTWGANVARQAQLSEVVVNIILYHHEKYGGQGYPSGIKGKDIPLEARIVAVADVYDALITDRPYRKGHSSEKTMSIMSSMGEEAFDAEILDVFLSLSGQDECGKPEAVKKEDD